jgi:DNA-binding NtrC family response regulator
VAAARGNFMSGYFEDAIAGELRKNAVAFLPKPFTRDQLLARTRHALSMQKTV